MRKVVSMVLDRSNLLFVMTLALFAGFIGIWAIVVQADPSSLHDANISAQNSPAARGDKQGYKEQGFASALDKARSAEALFIAEPTQANALSLSHALLAAGDYRTLADLLRQPERFQLDQSIREVLLAETDFRLQNFDGALSRSEALLDLNPSNVDAHFIKARAHYCLLYTSPSPRDS